MATINIYNEDCLPAMREMVDGQFDLAIVDPPYVQGKRGRTYTSLNKKLRGEYSMLRLDHGDKTKCDLGKRPTKEYWKELMRISKNYIVWGGAILRKSFTSTSMCYRVG